MQLYTFQYDESKLIKDYVCEKGNFRKVIMFQFKYDMNCVFWLLVGY